MFTKRQLVTAAFEEVGLASYVFDLTPEEVLSAVRRLDAQMASWDSRGIRIGYALTDGQSDPDDPSGVPDTAVEAIYQNLALRIAAGYGKAVSSDTKVGAKNSYDALVSLAAEIPEYQVPANLPTGQGSKYWRNYYNGPFSPQPQPVLDAGDDQSLDYNP